MVDNKLLPKLSQNLLETLDDEEYYDITIEAGNESNVEIFLLRYIYGGMIPLEEYDVLDIVKILVAVNELSLQELIPYLESFLIENKANWMEQNFDLIYQISFENDSFSELQKYCIDLISNKEPNKLFNSLNFSSISEKLLVTIIQNNNLRMSEIQVWEYVIKWGLAQNPELPADYASFSEDNFDTLKNTLQQLIPLIKFHNLTSKEFLHNVFPYREILPKRLYIDLLKVYLNSDYRPSKKFSSKNIDSMIISNQHVELISKWINKLEITDKLTDSYEFKLLYRDSRDGSNEMNNRFKNFHEICHNQVRTITIIKVKNSDEILGGYNPIEWKSNKSYGNTNDSFIFSFVNNDVENYILSRVMDRKYATYNSPFNSVGPSFGSSDLHLYQHAFSGELRVQCEKRYYKNKIRKINVSLFTEFEVFQIM
ncbi:carbohydrate-binding module family 13 protein [Rhizophagus clarus]|uniref:Carbohydrate-binding module family 13 protein n=1 Tax=Rhizophagus clarus TaxID=94130 RepID=A0A8H3KYM5_9GLOM|nr:carbohydrate-binding module family 13 protein [Rhizophagus clarus]